MAPNYTAVFLLKKLNYSFSENFFLYHATESWKMYLCLTLNSKIASSSQNQIKSPNSMHFLSLSFASLLVTIWSPARIYLYLDLFLLKFLFISKSSEWVLTFRFSPMTLSLHSLNVKEYISLISQVLTWAAWVMTVSQNLIFHPQKTPRSFLFSNLRWQWTTSEELLLTATKDLRLTLLLKATTKACSTRSTKFRAPSTEPSCKATW